MKNGLKQDPRKFTVAGHEVRDHGKVELGPGEMITVIPEGGGECDVTATNWGLYLAPSLNGRLANHGYRTVLVENADGKYFVNAVCVTRFQLFKRYLEKQNSRVIQWLDGMESLPEFNGE